MNDTEGLMSFRQLSVDQGEGKPQGVFEVCYDQQSSKAWKQKIVSKIQQFSVAIRKQSGYAVLLRKEYDPLDDIEVYYVQIPQAKQVYVFILNDFMCEVQIQKEAI